MLAMTLLLGSCGGTGREAGSLSDEPIEEIEEATAETMESPDQSRTAPQAVEDGGLPGKTFTMEISKHYRQVVAKRFGEHFIELKVDPVRTQQFELYFNGIYYDLYNAPHGLGENSIVFWEPGSIIRVPGVNSELWTPVILYFETLSETDDMLQVQVSMEENPDYGFVFNIENYLGEYYSGNDVYTFYMQNGELHLKIPNDSPYLGSGKLEERGYRRYLRITHSGMGEAWTVFTFNTSPDNRYGGRKRVNMVSDAMDYSSDGVILWKRN